MLYCCCCEFHSTLFRLLLDPNLLPDFFLDEMPEQISAQIKQQGGKPKWDVKEQKTSAAAASGSGSPVEQTFVTLQSMLNNEIVSSIGAVYAFDLKGVIITLPFSCLW